MAKCEAMQEQIASRAGEMEEVFYKNIPEVPEAKLEEIQEYVRANQNQFKTKIDYDDYYD